jgi:hypothetical protein
MEFWIKLKDINDINIFTKDSFALNIDQGQFKLSFRDQEIPYDTKKEYTLPMDQYIHMAILYRKSLKALIILLNCEEIIKFNIVLSGIEYNTPLIFGNEKLDAEMTEIRIWNQKMPINYIKENYKSPLPILSENKGKLKMNFDINKNFRQRYDSVFILPQKDKSLNFGYSNDKINFSSSNSSINIDNKGKEGEGGDNIIYDEDYPTMDAVNSNSINIEKINDEKYSNDYYYISKSSNNNAFFIDENYISKK